MQNVVLFDMDGTLTPHRLQMKPDMEDALLRLSKVSKIGIVTGSGFDYVMQQCGSLFKSSKDMSNFLILPCNGTQKYSWSLSEWDSSMWKKDEELNFRKHIGQKSFQSLMFMLIERLYITHMVHGSKIPVAGNFISYRGSLINWCPIGREATQEDRKKFMELDEKESIRARNIEVFNRSALSEEISFSMGGNTSIDVYPKGWDKTYALNYYEKHNHWFIGDRCTMDGGNDKPLYDKIKKVSPNQAFEVKSPKETIKIIDNIIGTLYNDA